MNQYWKWEADQQIRPGLVRLFPLRVEVEEEVRVDGNVRKLMSH